MDKLGKKDLEKLLATFCNLGLSSRIRTLTGESFPIVKHAIKEEDPKKLYHFAYEAGDEPLFEEAREALLSKGKLREEAEALNDYEGLRRVARLELENAKWVVALYSQRSNSSLPVEEISGRLDQAYSLARKIDDNALLQEIRELWVKLAPDKAVRYKTPVLDKNLIRLAVPALLYKDALELYYRAQEAGDKESMSLALQQQIKRLDEDRSRDDDVGHIYSKIFSLKDLGNNASKDGDLDNFNHVGWLLLKYMPYVPRDPPLQSSALSVAYLAGKRTNDHKLMKEAVDKQIEISDLEEYRDILYECYLQ